MAYATAANVQAHINQLGGTTLTLGGATVPTSTDVGEWLDQLSAEIDGILTANGYGTVPATGTSDVNMLKRYVAQKAAAMVFHAGFMWDDTPDKIGQWEKEWDTLLERLIDRSMRLVDQSPRSGLRVIYAQHYWED